MQRSLIFIAVAMMATVSLTACFNDDDAEQLTVTGLKKLGQYTTESEIVTYEKSNHRMYIIGGDNHLKIVNITDPVNPAEVGTIDLSPYGDGVNSVTTAGNLVAVAVEKENAADDSLNDQGSVEFFDLQGAHIQSVTVGYLPDMLTFNEDGTKVVVANEGEPNDNYDIDPEGSIGIINVADYSYTDIELGSISLMSTDGVAVRLGDTPSGDQARDLEPEFVAVSGDYAYVTLQENNALAKVNLTSNSLEFIKSLGAKSYEAGSGNTIDIEEEGVIKMRHYPGLFGLYQPDSIAAYTSAGSTYLVMANEGDGREYEGSENEFVDEEKISELTLDASIASAYEDDNDLKVMVDLGDTDGDGDYDKLYTYGARSFSIRDENGTLVWDSGDEISRKIAEMQPELFNQSNGEIDGRSGNKGGEPEALTIGEVEGKTYAFVGLERQNVILTYDISNPEAPLFIDYFITETAGNVSPEGMKFIAAADSPTGNPLLLVAYEYDPGDAPQATAVYEIETE